MQDARYSLIIFLTVKKMMAMAGDCENDKKCKLSVKRSKGGDKILKIWV
jgi:hypothetical protein